LFNRIILIGNLVDNSTVRGQDTKVTRFRLACTTKTGGRENTLFVDVFVPNRELEFKKGDRVLVEGSLQHKRGNETGNSYEVMALRCLPLRKQKPVEVAEAKTTADIEEEPF